MRTAIRVLLYLFGLFIITIGVNLSILSGLGISPVSAFTYPLSQATGISLGTVTVLTYSCLVGLQAAMLGKRFRGKDLLQIPFSVCFGFFVDLTGSALAFLHPQSYLERMAILLLGIVICAIGAAIYIAMDIVPNAPEGFNLAVSKRFEMPFSRSKVLSDCLFVATGAAISLIAFHRIIAIREGTLLSAFLTGKLIGIIGTRFNPTLNRWAFGPSPVSNVSPEHRSGVAEKI